MSIAHAFVQRPVMTTVGTVSVVLFGVLSFLKLPVNDLPTVDYPVIQVRCAYPGATPETVANTIATPLERWFMQINGLKQVTSKSTQGQASLVLEFDLDKSIDAAATDVQTAITQATASLPADLPSPPTYSKTNPNDQPILFIAMSSDSLTQGRLYDYASTQVGQRISILPGVSRVDVFGTKSAIRIKADVGRLGARGLTMEDLAAAVRGGTGTVGAGQLDGPAGTLLVQPEGQLETAAEYGALIVARHEGSPIRLRDVADVEETVQEERARMRFWVRGFEAPSATVVVAVNRRAGANAVEVAKSVRALLPVVNAELPGSIRITPIYDRSRSIVNSVADVEETLLIAFVLVVLVIFVFLGRATDTLIPAVALPMSLLLTFIAMRLLGYSLDNLSLMALTLAIGFLVDDAIVFLENTVRRMEHGESALIATLNGAKEIGFTIVSMTISLATVFLPLVFMSGLVGRIFREFAVTIMVSILASGLVSLTLTPLMCSRLLKARGQGVKSTFMERVMGAAERRVLDMYGRSLWWFLRHKWVSLGIWALTLAGTAWLFLIVPKAFLPAGDSSFLRGLMIGREGSSPAQMHRLQDRADQIMRADPAVRATFSVTGNSSFMASNQGFLLAFLEAPEQRPPIEAVAGRMMGGLASIPGAFSFLRANPVLEIATGATGQSQGQFSYALSGVDPALVYATADRLRARLFGYPGFQFLLSDRYTMTPGAEVTIRRERARLLGVSETRILSLLRTAYSQHYVYLIKTSSDQYQVILEAEDAARAGAEDLALLRVRSDDGKSLIPLGELVEWKTTVGAQAVNHLNQFTSVTFSFNLVPGWPVGDATDFVEKVASEVLPSAVQGGFEGEALTFRDTLKDLTLLMFLAVFVMYVILAILYESYVHPLTVLSTLPTALLGGLAALQLFGEQASLYAFIGMFMLMGIVKKNGIMIVDFARQRVDHGEAADRAIHDASLDRFRPILMTTLAAVVGAIPIALGYGADGASRRPLGLVIVGGLLVSQILTLYVTPPIYLIFELFQEKVLDRTSFFRSSRRAPTGLAPRKRKAAVDAAAPELPS